MRIHHALRAAAGAGAGGDGGDGFALSFHNTSNQVDTTTLASTLGVTGGVPRTIEAWAKSFETDTANGGVFGYGTSVSSGDFTIVLNNTVTGDVKFNTSGNDIITTVSSAADSWFHAAFVYDGTFIIGYVNGKEVGKKPASLNTQDTDLFIGLWNAFGPSYFKGYITDCRVWNVARTKFEIANNANTALTGGEAGLVAHWPMSSGSGSILTDNAGTNDGTINGATWVERSAFPDISFTAPFALSFDGSNDYVDLNSDIMFASGGAPWGVFMWVYPATVSKLMHLTGVKSSLSPWTAPSHYSIDANGKLTWWDESTSWKVSTTTLTTNQWYFVGLSHDGAGNITLWVDGVKESIDPVSGNSTDCGIGNFFRRGHGTDRYYNGDAGKVIIYSEEPTEARVKDDANASLSGTETNIIAYWPTNSGSGATLVDKAGTNDGTISGATWVERSEFPQI